MIFNIESIEKEVGNYFDVGVETFYQKQGKHHEAKARHFLWFILHDCCGMSYPKIGKKYSCSRRAVIRYVSEMRFRVENLKQDILAYEYFKQTFDF